MCPRRFVNSHIAIHIVKMDKVSCQCSKTFDKQTFDRRTFERRTFGKQNLIDGHLIDGNLIDGHLIDTAFH